MSTVRRHLNIIDDNLRDARRRVIAVWGESIEWNRNELILRLLQDLLIVEEHLESAMLEDDKANDSGVHPTVGRNDGDEPSRDVAEADSTDDVVRLARSMQQRRHGGPP